MYVRGYLQGSENGRVVTIGPIKFTEGFKSGKKHPLPIDLSTENKKAKRSAYEKER